MLPTDGYNLLNKVHQLLVKMRPAFGKMLLLHKAVELPADMEKSYTTLGNYITKTFAGKLNVRSWCDMHIIWANRNTPLT